jgi:FkbM family methyltransferase
MSLLSTIRFITQHPLNKKTKVRAVLRFVKWQIGTRLNPYPIIYPFTEKSRLIVQKGMAGATGNLYCGLHEFNDMFFLLHFLRKEDTFMDIGANIGSYSILASSQVGTESISIEPVPTTFNHLLQNIAINQAQLRITALNMALGSTKGFIEFTSQLDTVNHVAVEKDPSNIKVPVDTVDNIMQQRKKPSLIKIDVEGFETEVIRGAIATLSDPTLKAIIIELNGSGAKYGYDENKIKETLTQHDFKAYCYFPQERKLVGSEHADSGNLIYIRDTRFVEKRLAEAAKVKILNEEI